MPQNDREAYQSTPLPVAGSVSWAGLQLLGEILALGVAALCDCGEGCTHLLLGIGILQVFVLVWMDQLALRVICMPYLSPGCPRLHAHLIAPLLDFRERGARS